MALVVRLIAVVHLGPPRIMNRLASFLGCVGVLEAPVAVVALTVFIEGAGVRRAGGGDLFRGEEG
jgi:hypothetical protein